MWKRIQKEIKGVEKPMKKFFKDFRDFAVQGNVIDLAVGVMIGGAFGKIVSSLVNDIFMPIIGAITGGVDFNDLALTINNVTINYGAFITNVIDFILIAFFIFLVVRAITKVMPKKPAAPAEPTRTCPYCRTTISAYASKCPNCTAEVQPTETAPKTA